MKPWLLMPICLWLCPAAYAQLDLQRRAGPDWIREPLSTAEVVVDATIQSVRSAGYQYRKASDICGFIHEATITESFKGGHSGTIRFATQQPLAPQSRHLLFLSNADRLPFYSRETFKDPDDPDFSTNLLKARTSCSDGLPRLKLSDSQFFTRGDMPFLSSRDGRNWFVVPDFVVPVTESIRIKVQQIQVDGTPTAIEFDPSRPAISIPGFGWQGQAMPWNALRKMMLDYEPGGARRNDTPMTLEQANEEMQANLDRNLREFSGKRELIAAIRSSQKAWAEFMQAACTVLTAAPDPTLEPFPTSECRRELTRVRARELKSLEYSSGWYEFPSLEQQRKIITDDINDHLESLANGIVIEPSVDASFAASRKVWKTWEAWAKASCRMVTTRWPESTHRQSLQSRCQLLAIQTWDGVVRTWHIEDGEFLLKRNISATAAKTLARP